MKPQVQLGEPLTNTQIADIQRIRDEWLTVGLSTERCDRPTAEAAVRAAYRAAGLAEPSLMVWMDSPMGGAVASAAVRELLGGDQLGDQLWGQLRDQLWGQLRGQLRDQLGEQLRDQLGEQLWEQLGEQLWEQLGDQLWEQLGDQLRDQELSPWWDSYWLTYYQCAIRLAGLDASARLDTLADATRQLGWWWPMTGAVILTDRPTTLTRDQQGRLHNATGPALAYADGYTLHAWHGTRVPADLIDTGWDIEHIMAEPNAEVRRCAIERMGWPGFIAAAGLTLVDECDDPGNPGQTLRLYDIPRRVLDLPVRVLVCVNATCERDGSRHTFGLTVPTDCKTAIEAAAWTFGLTAKEYQQLSRAC